MMASRFRFALVTSLLCSVAAPAAADWHRIDTPNFILVGDVSARELRGLAGKFEGFRETLTRVLSKGATAAAVPTVVIVFPNDKAFTPFKPTYQGKPIEGIRGLFVPGQHINQIAMVSGSEESDRIVFHEYTHLVIGNLMPRVPIWLNEGLAEFYSTFRLMDGGRRAQLGMPIVEHLQLLQQSGRLQLPELLKVDRASPFYNESARATVFYAESWALTHLILNGHPSRVNELAAYLRSVNGGVPEDRAWEESFGTARMDQAFRGYLQRPTYNTVVIEFSDSVTNLPAAAVDLRPSDADAFLAGFLAARHELDRAASRLATAMRDDPGNPLVNATMAQIEIGQQQSAKAEARLLAAGKTEDWFASYATGIALTELTDGPSTTDRENEVIRAARLRFDAVQRARANLPNVLVELVSLELRHDGVPSSDMRSAIARARELAPGRVDYAFVQAQLLGRVGDFAGARNVLGPLMTDSFPPDVRNAARRLMGVVIDWQNSVQSANRRAERPATPTSTGSTRVAAPDARSESPRHDDRGGKFRPEYRPVGSGEARLEGTLRQIDCQAGGAARFHVDGGESVPLVAPRLLDVDFITYRDNVTGGVNCGVLKVPMRVFVTWREGNADRQERVVVAIEFLPRD